MTLARRITILSLLMSLSLLPAAPALADTVYTVQPGDTLTRIANRFNVTVEALAQANHLLNPNAIQVGQPLTIPDGAGASAQPAASGAGSYVVRPGDSWYRIAARLGVDAQRLMDANPGTSQTLQPGQVLVVPAQAPVVSSVRQRISGSAGFVQRVETALDWMEQRDQGAFQRVDQYVTAITPSPYANLALARPLPNGGCLVRALARADMPTRMVAALLFHEATHCVQFATVGVQSDKVAEMGAYSEQIKFMERNGFPPDEISFYQHMLACYAAYPDDGRSISPSNC